MSLTRSLAGIAVATVSLYGCDRSAPTEPGLPESPMIRNHAIVAPSRLLADAESEFDQWRAKLLNDSSEHITGVAHTEAILAALRRQADPLALVPSTLVASYGDDCADEPYISVIGLIPSREITGIRFVFADQKGEERTVAVEVCRDCKSIEYFELLYFRRIVNGWEKMKLDIPQTLSLRLEQDMKFVEIPWPEDSDVVSCAVAIEDKRGVGNFILSTHYDAPDPKKLIEQSEN